MRGKTSIIVFAIVAIAIGILIFAYTTKTAASVVPFTPIAHGEESSMNRRVNYRITSASQLSELWKTLNATGTPPVVDFKTHDVLAVFAGPESCTKIAVAKIEDTNKRMISITVAKPDYTCDTKPSATSPYEIVVVPTTSLPLTHQDLLATADCPN
ncbi:MAG: hypothetical protein WCW36_01990 [Candidatus Paceibacterota bacterium]|jgi:hypothetical protein